MIDAPTSLGTCSGRPLIADYRQRGSALPTEDQALARTFTQVAF
jgi:hypothetical protein